MAYTASKEAFQACFDSMFVGAPEDAATDVLKLVVPEYTQTVDGKELTFDQFVGHVSHFRAAAKSVKTQVHHFLRDGAQIAEHHTVTVTMNDGSVSKLEVYMFGKLAADGRIQSVVETAKKLE